MGECLEHSCHDGLDAKTVFYACICGGKNCRKWSLFSEIQFLWKLQPLLLRYGFERASFQMSQQIFAVGIVDEFGFEIFTTVVVDERKIDRAVVLECRFKNEPSAVAVIGAEVAGHVAQQILVCHPDFLMIKVHRDVYLVFAVSNRTAKDGRVCRHCRGIACHQ